MMAPAPAIGIDLGTAYSRVGTFRNGGVEIIANRNGDRKIPSYVAFTDTERLIGYAAKHHVATINPKNLIFGSKRLLGRKFDDRTVQVNMNRWPFDVINHFSKPKVKVEFDGEQKIFHPEEISSMLLQELKETAEAYLRKPVTDAVISVPAHFDDSQRQATIDAGTIAGLNVLGLINEPSAAALAYGLFKKGEGEHNVLIFNLGAGSLDVSIVKIKDGIFKVKSTAADRHLGGDDFDGRMIDHFVRDFRTRHKKNLSRNNGALLRLKVACEKAKRSLSSFCQATIEIDSLHEGIDFYTSITRAQFEELNADLFGRILEPVNESISAAKLDKSKIDNIVLVGGSTRIPKIRELLADFFDVMKLNEIGIDEPVVCGAAIQAAIKQGGQSGQSEQLIADTLLIEVLSTPLCVVTSDLPKNDLVEKNATIPLKKTFSFFSSENVTEELIQIYEGEKVMDVGNKLIGNFSLKNISTSFNLLDIRLDIDTNGIVSISAEDNETKNKLTVLSNKGRLTQNEIKRLIAETKRNKAERMEHEASVAAKNALKLYCSNIKKIVESTKKTDKISEAVKKWIFLTCNQSVRRLNPNQFLGKLDFERKQMELSSVLDPIILELQESNDVPAVPGTSQQAVSICETRGGESGVTIKKETTDVSSACDRPRKRLVHQPFSSIRLRGTSDRNGPNKKARYSDPLLTLIPRRPQLCVARSFREPVAPLNSTQDLQTPPLPVGGH